MFVEIEERDAMTFAQFWYAVNAVLKDRGLPESLYGEAMTLWRIGKEAPTTLRRVDTEQPRT